MKLIKDLSIYLMSFKILFYAYNVSFASSMPFLIGYAVDLLSKERKGIIVDIKQYWCLLLEKKRI